MRPESGRPFTGFACLSRAGEPTRHAAARRAADASLGEVKGNAPRIGPPLHRFCLLVQSRGAHQARCCP